MVDDDPSKVACGVLRTCEDIPTTALDDSDPPVFVSTAASQLDCSARALCEVTGCAATQLPAATTLASCCSTLITVCSDGSIRTGGAASMPQTLTLLVSDWQSSKRYEAFSCTRSGGLRAPSL